MLTKCARRLGKPELEKSENTLIAVIRLRVWAGLSPAIKHIPISGLQILLEAVNEERIEVACEKDQAADIIRVIKEVHPYEEVVIDIYAMLSL
jgi:hypothetical protein